jgi:ribosomal protein S18 acetylase RimI-like enzyme
VRLAALRDHPEAFGVSYQEELAGDTSRLIAKPPGVTLGGFAGGELVGTAGLSVPERAKQRHKGHIAAVYVAPAWRGTGLARGLIEGLVAHARARGLAVVTLSVTAGNQAARRVYADAGFVTYGTEPRSLCVGGAFHDEALMALLLDQGSRLDAR